jgi:hypothetical protein
MQASAFYCLADERFFLGVAGLINSLRRAGHDQPIYLLDIGLTTGQRDRLASEVTVVPGPRDVAPWLLKTLAPRANPAEVMVLIDADMIVTRSLAPLIDRARDGGVIAFCNDRDRFCPEWGDLLDLGPLRRERYISSGLVALGGGEGAEVLELLHDRQRRVNIELGFYGRDVPGYPFTFPEQDVLNAILDTRPDPDRTVRLANRLAANPPYRGLRIVDGGALRCAYDDGTEPYVLHQFVRKPWLERMHHGIYSKLLVRALLDDGAAVEVKESELPLRMRRGARARVARLAVDIADLSRWYVTEVIPDRVRSRLGRPRHEAGETA